MLRDELETVHEGARVDVQVYEVNRKLLQEHAAPLMAVYLHGVAVVRQELNMDVGRKAIKGPAFLMAAACPGLCMEPFQ